MISTTTKRHRFLNALALIMNGSKPCTAIYPWLENKQVLICRNEPLTNDDQIYFDRFFSLIRVYAHVCLISNEKGMNEIKSTLLSIVLEYNKEKCIKRIVDPLFDDAVTNLEKLLAAQIDTICENVTVGQLRKGSADYVYLEERQMPLKYYVSQLLFWADRILVCRRTIIKQRKNPDLRTIEECQRFSYFLYDSQTFRSIVSYKYPSVDDHKRIQYYINKVSAHFRSLDLILACLEQRTSDYGEVYKSIQWHFIEPIQAVVTLDKTPSSSFDEIWNQCRLPDDDKKTDFICEYIGDKFTQYDSNLELSTCLHSEIRMIDYIIEHKIHEVDDGDIEIGISKLPCYCCSLYIEELNKHFGRKFCINGFVTHGKIYSKWMFRNAEDETIKENVNKGLYELVKHELMNWDNRVRTKSGESDQLDTNIEDEEVAVKRFRSNETQ